MFGILKHKGLTLLIIASSLLIGCSTTKSTSSETKVQWNQIKGETQGTTYGIILNDPESKIRKEHIDSILHDFDLALSSYIETSIVSQVNNATDSVSFDDSFGYFDACYHKSRDIFDLTEGAFDPSVFPLVKAWGFFGKDFIQPSQEELDETLEYVGFGKPLHDCLIINGNGRFTKKNPAFRLDFNAIAQGYSVDVLAQFLEKHGISDYYVEIGGEIVVKGKNKDGVNWRIGVDSPNQEEGKRIIEAIGTVDANAEVRSQNG